MPGTIHVSVLELVGLPSPPQSSSMGVKVSMGKQAYEMQDKEETSFALASLRDKLNVSIRDSQGNELAHTDVETRSIVEKGTWDDLFPFKDGGHIRMKLHFILTEVELNRIRSMRESAARKKQEDLLKRRHSSSDLAGASGGSPASSQDSLKSRHQTPERNVEPSDSQASKISADAYVKVLNNAQPGQKKQAFSTSKSTGALDKLPANQQLKEKIQGQNAGKQNQLDQTPSNVRKMILALESSPVKEDLPATNKTSATTQLSSSTTVDKEASLKNMVAVNTKPVLSKLDSAPASLTPEEIGEERGVLLPATNITKEMARSSSNTSVYTPSKVPNLKKTVVFNVEPILSNLESAPVLSTPEEIRKERGEILPNTDETKVSAQLRSNSKVVKPSKAPILKKMVSVSTKSVMFNLEAASVPSTPEELGEGRGKLLPASNKTKETAQLSSNSRVDAPSKVPILKKTVAEIETTPTPLTPEEIGKEREKLLPANNNTKETAQISSNTRENTPFKVPILKKIVAVNSETVVSNPKPPAAPTSEGMGRGRGKDEISDENNISKTQHAKDENNEEKETMIKFHTSPISERSIFSLKTLLEALPRRKQSSTELFNKKYGFTTNEDLVIEKKWRSKQWKSSQCRANSKVINGNEECSIDDSYRGWIFLNEMIRSCILSDDRPFVEVPEGCLSNCSQDNDQEKLTETGNTQRKSEKSSTGSKKLESNRRPNNISFTGPGGQVMKIAIMAGFGLLVFLTRQRK